MFTRINLYKNCILTARNTEVFRSQSILEEYLETLDKPYTTDIEIPNVYTTLSGTITIDAIPLNGDFNYIKFEEFDDNNVLKQKVYAFIDSFKIINDLIVIDYTTDIFHTYMESVEIRYGFLSNTKFYNEYGIPLADIPLKPYGVATYDDYPKVPMSINDTFYILAEITVFRSTNYEQNIAITNPDRYVTFISSSDIYTTENNEKTIDILFNYNNMIKYIRYLAVQQSVAVGTYGYYRVEKLFVINSKLLDREMFPVEVGGTKYFDYVKIGKDKYNWAIGADNMYFFYHTIPADYSSPEIELEDNIENISFGFYTKQFKLPFSGKKHYAIIKFIFTDYNLKSYLFLDNKLEEITNCFELEMPINTISGSEIETRAIKVALEQSIRETQAVINVGSGLVKSGTQLASGFALGNAGMEVSGVASTAGAVIQGIGEVIQLDNKAELDSAQRYDDIVQVNAQNDTLINMTHDLFIRKVRNNDTSNVSIIRKIVNQQGYNVSGVVKTIIYRLPYDDITYFDYIKFSSIIIVGLSTEITNKLCEIFKNGIKIWYTGNRDIIEANNV